MQNIESWKPTKFVLKNGRLCAAKDRKQLSVASRLVGDLTAEFYCDAFRQHARGRLLDMGCGMVPFFAAYRPYVSDVVCIDWANSLHANPHLDLECDLSEDIPLPDNSFDTILLSDVLEHLPEPARCWSEIARLLAPGGKVLLNVPFYYQLHEVPHDYYRYTEHALRRFVELSGLQLVELKAMGGAVEILADIVSKLMLGVPGGRFPAAWLQSVASAFARSAWGRRIAARTSPRFPFAYFVVAARPAQQSC